jgi:hypothetical protein
MLVYVDNPFHTTAVLKLTFPGLGKSFHPDDGGTRWDEFHLVNCIKDTTRTNHPLVKSEHGDSRDRGTACILMYCLLACTACWPCVLQFVTLTDPLLHPPL